MSSIDPASIAEKVQDLLARHLRMERDKVKPESRLREDLGLDSADTIELVFTVEETYNIQIPDEDLERFKTVSDLSRYVEDWLQRTPQQTTPPKEP